MKMYLRQVIWQFTLLYRNKLIHISVLITAMYGFLFFLLRGFDFAHQVLILLIYNDPAIIGMFFIGISILIEKEQKILEPLLIIPANKHLLVLSRITTLSLIGWLCTVCMTIPVAPASMDWLSFAFGVLGTCVIFCITGIFVISYSSDFLGFILRCIPILFFLSIPLLNYYQVTDLSLFYFMPIHGSLALIANALDQNALGSSLYFNLTSTLCWIIVLYFITFRIFMARLVKSS